MYDFRIALKLQIVSFGNSSPFWETMNETLIFFSTVTTNNHN